MATKTRSRPLEAWGQRSPARLVDREARPIREGARVTCTRGGRRVSGQVLDVYFDYKYRAVIEVLTDYGARFFRPEEVKVQRPRKKGRH